MYYVTGINRLINYIRSIFKKTFCKHTWKLLYTKVAKFYDEEDWKFYKCPKCGLYMKEEKEYFIDDVEFMNTYYYDDKDYLKVFTLELVD